MDQNRIKRNQMLGAKIVKELTARNMEAYYTDSKEEALKKALELIPEGSSISWGGSMSVNEIIRYTTAIPHRHRKISARSSLRHMIVITS